MKRGSRPARAYSHRTLLVRLGIDQSEAVEELAARREAGAGRRAALKSRPFNAISAALKGQASCCRALRMRLQQKGKFARLGLTVFTVLLSEERLTYSKLQT